MSSEPGAKFGSIPLAKSVPREEFFEHVKFY